MITGRGLGHTGGTGDKLEWIPGYKTGLNTAEMHAALETAGCFIALQTTNFCPADTRDITSTVKSIPLITSSIVSKKAAEGLEALVLDVKFGRAAFLKDYDPAKTLAQAMVSKFSFIFTFMNFYN